MDSNEIEVKSTTSGVLADEIIIEPKDPVSPGAPGGGGLAKLLGLTGYILGAEDFCSVYNFPGAGFCVVDPNYEGEITFEGQGFMPVWCLGSTSLPLCNGSTLEINPDTGNVFDQGLCFDSSWNTIPCSTSGQRTFLYTYNGVTGQEMTMQQRIDDVKLPHPGERKGYFKSMDLHGVPCVDQNGNSISCDLMNSDGTQPPMLPKSWSYFADGCFIDINYSQGTYTKVPCALKVTRTPVEGNFYLDPQLRIRDYNTATNITNNYYSYGYPILPEPEPEPEPLPPPFDPGPNPFNPTYPEPVEGEECATIVCECISYVVNALGAVNNTILKVDETLLGMVDQLDEIHNKMPNWFEKLPLELLPLVLGLNSANDTLDEILTAIDDISFNVTKEAETNFWDVLGGMFSDIFGLVEFIIEKIIYLVVPENTDFIRENITMLNATMDQKFEPVNMLKVTIQESLMAESQAFEDIEMNLPIYGRVEFMDFEWVNFAVPVVRSFLAGVMIIITSVWAYRKITSDMVR